MCAYSVCTSSVEAYRCCVRLSSCLPLPEAGRDRQACPRYLGIEGFIMFSIFFEKYAKICRFALSFNHDSAADWIYSLFFARNNLMNIMCKVGDYIQKVNNIAKTSTQTNTQKRSTQKTDDSIANNQKNRRLQKVRVKVRLRMR